jgi:ABC-type lipoprotein release transport system permease subunit
MTLSANIKDSMWELGVLRSMGCTRGQITRVMIYELISNTLSAMTLGYSSGIIVSCLAIA